MEKACSEVRDVEVGGCYRPSSIAMTRSARSAIRVSRVTVKIEHPCLRTSRAAEWASIPNASIERAGIPPSCTALPAAITTSACGRRRAASDSETDSQVSRQRCVPKAN